MSTRWPRQAAPPLTSSSAANARRKTAPITRYGVGEGPVGEEATGARRSLGTSQRRERAKTLGCREKGKSWYTNMIHLWLLEKMHAEAPRSESVRLGQRVLACPEARIRGTRTTVQSQLVGRELSNKNSARSLYTQGSRGPDGDKFCGFV